MLVQQILKSKGQATVVTVAPGTLVSDAAQTLAERRIGVLVVSGDGKAIDGILSERDIVRSIGTRGAACLGDVIDGIMTRNPVCCSMKDTTASVMSRMTDGRFRHMPVVEEGALVGIVTIGDVVKAQLDELAMEKNALEGMIMGH